MNHALNTLIALGCMFVSGVHVERGDWMEPLNLMGAFVAVALGAVVAFPDWSKS